MHLSPRRTPLATLGTMAGLALALSACADPLAPSSGVVSAAARSSAAAIFSSPGIFASGTCAIGLTPFTRTPYS